MTRGPLSQEAVERVLDRPRLATGGAALTRAAGAVVLVHGRGAGAAGILPLGEALAFPDLALLAPEASGRTWYPHSFLAPLAANEPHLSRALAEVGGLLDDLIAAGMPSERIALLGFSQGACLALETVARLPRRYGAVLAFSGGLIGPPGTPRAYAGRFERTPIFLGCSDVDPHIPLERVQESTQVLASMGAEVTERIYPGFGHGVNDDEIAHARRLLAPLSQPA
jgi:predicted esterase